MFYFKYIYILKYNKYKYIKYNYKIYIFIYKNNLTNNLIY